MKINEQNKKSLQLEEKEEILSNKLLINKSKRDISQVHTEPNYSNINKEEKIDYSIKELLNFNKNNKAIYIKNSNKENENNINYNSPHSLSQYYRYKNIKNKSHKNILPKVINIINIR